MEETLEGGRGPPRAVAPLERERERERELVLLFRIIQCTDMEHIEFMIMKSNIDETKSAIRNFQIFYVLLSSNCPGI
jgi:hypothetical protein